MSDGEPVLEITGLASAMAVRAVADIICRC